MPGTNLIVPVVLWGKHAPTHCISSIYLSRDQKTLVTGCYDGQICIWQVHPETLKMTPRCLLVGHTAPVTCLSRASIIQDNNFIVSSSEAGEMCTWDLVDGKCRESVKLSQVHTNIQAYHMCNSDDLRLFCNGYYAEILIMDPFSLEILFSLSSKMNPDWISALHVLRPSSRKDDVVLAISITGTVKVWSLLGHENKQSEPIYENESKQIRCLNALSLNCCAYNQRTVLIVCAKYCQVYDAGDFSVLCSIQAPSGERWMSGDFLAPDRILVWSTEGKGYLYKLPANSVPDHKGFHGPTVDHDSPVLYGILAHPDNKLLSCPPAMRFVITSAGGTSRRRLLRGDSAGVVSVWDVDQAAALVPDKMPSHAPIVMTSLDMAWAEMNPSPVGILDQLNHPEEPEIKLTASIYLLAANRLVVGREDGSIVIVNATHTVQLQLLHGSHQQFDDWPRHQLLLGHNGRVNCLLYPHHVHQRYDKAHLVSGGIDFAVCLWDLFTGSLLHRFCVHAGEITQLIVPPSNCTARIQKCICSVASDHSVTLLSLAERKCVTLASRHLFPVVSIKWRPADDFMVVGCSDGTVYVWQMETGHLDRVLHGMIAEEVLAACDETLADDLGGSLASGTSDLQGLANPAVHFFRGLRHRNVAAMRAATQRGLAALQGPGHASNAGPLAEPARARRAQLTIQGFRSNPKDPESHILFFDIEGLIVELLSEEYSAMSPASLEAAGLITSEYMKVAALTQSASPDATKRISDFFGRVKDKAGDMERLLKEKDKHGILAKMKEGAETMQTKLQAKAEQLKGHLDPKAAHRRFIGLFGGMRCSAGRAGRYWSRAACLRPLCDPSRSVRARRRSGHLCLIQLSFYLLCQFHTNRNLSNISFNFLYRLPATIFCIVANAHSHLSFIHVIVPRGFIWIRWKHLNLKYFDSSFIIRLPFVYYNNESMRNYFRRKPLYYTKAAQPFEESGQTVDSVVDDGEKKPGDINVISTAGYILLRNFMTSDNSVLRSPNAPSVCPIRKKAYALLKAETPRITPFDLAHDAPSYMIYLDACKLYRVSLDLEFRMPIAKYLRRPSWPRGSRSGLRTQRSRVRIPLGANLKFSEIMYFCCRYNTNTKKKNKVGSHTTNVIFFPSFHLTLRLVILRFALATLSIFNIQCCQRTHSSTSPVSMLLTDKVAPRRVLCYYTAAGL
ncbi:hypothetical protein ABMA27_011058 [Loxostege sticticalis]|uniref:WD repeat-containing protein 7 n=1 Tax=Loxostege sticticalis TaxID=481309 RepID=A0ABR3H359_LOXSC